MPDHTRCVINAVSDPSADSNSVSANNNNEQQDQQQQQQQSRFTPITYLLQNQRNSPKFSRRYSKPQGDSEISPSSSSSNAVIPLESSVDGELVLENFQKSLALNQHQQQQPQHQQSYANFEKNSPNSTNLPRCSSSPNLVTARQKANAGASDFQSSFPQKSVLASMVGTNKKHQQQQSDCSTSVMSSDSNRINQINNAQSVAIAGGLSQNNSIKSSSSSSSNRQVSIGGCGSGSGSSTSSDFTDSSSSSSSSLSSSSSFGLLSRTRQFGTWLGFAVDGEKVDITKKDLNVFAPTTF